MKNILLVLLSLLIIGIWGCKKEEVVSNQNNSIEESGIGTIEGYVGYFSVALPPPDSNLGVLPSGYTFSSYHWVTDSPSCSYSMIYLLGQDSLLRDAIYVKASGKWEQATQKYGTADYSYLKLTVESIEIIQKK